MKNKKSPFNDPIEFRGHTASLAGSLATFDVMLDFIRLLKDSSRDVWGPEPQFKTYVQATDIALDGVINYAQAGRQRIAREMAKYGLDIPKMADVDDD